MEKHTGTPEMQAANLSAPAYEISKFADNPADKTALRSRKCKPVNRFELLTY
jgi:hypothetical protein